MNSFNIDNQLCFVDGGQQDHFFLEELISSSSLGDNNADMMHSQTDCDPLYYHVGMLELMAGKQNLHDDYTSDRSHLGFSYYSDLSQDGSSNTATTTSTGSHYSNGESDEAVFVHYPAHVAGHCDQTTNYSENSFCNYGEPAVMPLDYNFLMNYGIRSINDDHVVHQIEPVDYMALANVMATDDGGAEIMDTIHPVSSVEEDSSCNTNTNSKKRTRGSDESKGNRKARKTIRSKRKNKDKPAELDVTNNDEGEDHVEDAAADKTRVLETFDQDEIDVNGGDDETSTISTTDKVKRTTRKTGSSPEAQSLYARKRRERINERLRILQGLVPNGKKLDMSTMLDEAVHYVKFLQHQIKMLSSDDMWMYAPIVHNGMGTTITTTPSF